MKRRLSRWVTLVAVALVSAHAPSAQQSASPQRAETAAAAAVVVDVVVRDRRGVPVLNLGESDFEIYEDDVQQAIGSFQRPVNALAGRYARQRASAARTAGGDASARAPLTVIGPTRAEEPPVIALVFDQLGLEAQALARRAALRYVGSGRESASVLGVFDVRRTLAPLQPFTRDAERLRVVLGAARDVPSTALTSAADPVVTQGLRGFRLLEADAAGYASAHALIALAHAMGRMPGRKAIVLFSEGLSITSSTDVRFESLIDAANRANVAIYGVDAAGLRAESEQLALGQTMSRVRDNDGNLQAGGAMPTLDGRLHMSMLMASRGLGLLSRDTGGQFIESTNDLGRAFRRVDEDSLSYYTLTYVSRNAVFDGKFRRLAVKLRKPGLSTRTRSGYRALAGASVLPMLTYEAPAIARLEAAPLPNDFPIQARAYAFPAPSGPALVPLVVSVQAGALEHRRDDGRGTFVAEAVVLTRLRDERGEVIYKASQPYALSGRLDEIDASRRGELLFSRRTDLPPGLYTLEAIVYDVLAETASVRVTSLEVPVSTGGLVVSSAFLVRRGEAVPAANRDSGNPFQFGDLLLTPHAGEPLPSTLNELTFAFTVWPVGGAPAAASVELRRAGAVVAGTPLDLAAPDAAGGIRHISRLTLESLVPGAYELHVIVEAGAQQVTRIIPFRVVAR
jgi:VWFA-related protein